MTNYFKVNGVWTEVTRPYVKRSNAWVPVNETWVKRAGVWVRSYEFDVTPPPAPVVALTNIATTWGENGAKNGNHIRVGVSVPGGGDDIRLIRVLTTFNGKAPSTPTGGTYTALPDDNFPDEPWSDFEFGPGKEHGIVTNVQNKTWPRSAKDQTVLKPGKYYFSAWSQDDAGLWSEGTHASIEVATASPWSQSTTQKEAKFTPNFVGSFSYAHYTGGEMRQQGNPRSRGVIGYGSQVTNTVGKNGAPTIQSAQIYLVREANDGGQAKANIYIGWHSEATAVGIGNAITQSEPAVLGTLSKGEGKWFSIPKAYYNNLNGNIKGFVILDKHPLKAAAQSDDFSILKSAAKSPKQGTLAVVWTEAL